ncbi:Putative outer membrane lipoprotein [Salmonella bongori]|nr:Putative outer membrane lipoprotein [Salmonella bongori]
MPRQQGENSDRSAAIGLMFSLSLGASKEFWDSRPQRKRLELERFCLGCRWRYSRLRYLADSTALKTQTLSFTMQHQ